MNEKNSFYRGSTYCDYHMSPCGWEWHAFAAVGRSHPYYKRLFVVLPRTLFPLTHVSHDTNSPADVDRWWFTIGPIVPKWTSNEVNALLALRMVGDELTMIEEVGE